MQIDTVIYYAVYDAKLYAYGAVNPISALSNLAATTLRNIVGELELDGTLTSRDTINAKMIMNCIRFSSVNACFWGLRGPKPRARGH